MSLLKTTIVAGVAYWYGKRQGRKQAELAVQKIEQEQTSVLEGGPVVGEIDAIGRAVMQRFPVGWARRGYQL